MGCGTPAEVGGGRGGLEVGGVRGVEMHGDVTHASPSWTVSTGPLQARQACPYISELTWRRDSAQDVPCERQPFARFVPADARAACFHLRQDASPRRMLRRAAGRRCHLCGSVGSGKSWGCLSVSWYTQASRMPQTTIDRGSGLRTQRYGQTRRLDGLCTPAHTHNLSHPCTLILPAERKGAG